MPDRDRERAILIGVALSRESGRNPAAQSPEESLEELRSLAESAGAEAAEIALQKRETFDAATLIGSGKVTELAGRVDALDADVVIFDRDLSPTQQRNLEASLSAKVIDRTQLILDIFARRARTREGQLQVELAQLTYVLPRLTGRGVAMSRLGGGIGTRGPGETQLETDRRKIARRIRKINEQLESVRAARGVQRRQRRSIPLPALAMVGYTNAGKSTLFNRLTGAGVTADARMFATLDPTVRLIALPGRRQAVVSDTVGFIRNLPTTLVKAFRATLEEVTEAALLIHVVDASSPHAEQHVAHVIEVLAEIGAAAITQLLALNKIDLVGDRVEPEAMLSRLLARAGQGTDQTGAPRRAVAVSARTGEGVERLLASIDELLPADPVSRVVYRFPGDAGKYLSLLHERARILRKEYEEPFWVVEADVPESLRKRLERFAS
ncbi:MAG: GTPase HflX [Bryobacteraceae bacterium]|nr:GTPase HflX [Bryobacteraceae bacterium]